MEVTLQKTNDLEGRLSVAVTEADYSDKVDKELREIGRSRTIPGFRKGHVTIDQLRRRFGKEVKSHVLNDEVYRAVIDYIRDQKLDILGEPLPVEVKEVNLDDKDYTFQYEVGFGPKLDFEVTKDLHAPLYTIEVSQEMVDEHDRQLCRRFGAQVPNDSFEPDALVKGSLMELNPDGSIKEAEDAIQVVSTIVAPQYFKDDDQRRLFDGKKVGDKVVFNPAKTCQGNPAELASMLNIDKERAAGVTADFELAIAEIIVLRPAKHGEELYKEAFPSQSISDEKEYFDALRDMIARELAPNTLQMFNRDIQEILMQRYGNFELPAAFLKKWLVARNDELTPEQVDKDFEQMVPSIKWELISGYLLRKNEIKVSDDDMLQYAKGMAFQQFMQYGMANMDDATITNFARHILEDKKYASQMYDQVQTRKLFNVLRAQVTLDEKTVSLDEFKKLANPEPSQAPAE